MPSLPHTDTALATLAARARATMLGAILEEPPFVDDTSALGARAGGGANVLQRHEELVRACAALPPPPDPSDWFVVRPATEALATASAAVAALLHERCALHARASFDDDAPEMTPVRGGKREVVEALASSAAPIVRLEPAELLPNGDTRAHWHDADGGRHSQLARWAADGTALRIVAVDGAPPPTHREWLERLEAAATAEDAGADGAAVLAGWLAPEVTLHDPPAPRASGVAAVAPRLVRWGARFRGRAHAVSRAVHVGGGWTQLHLVGSWPEAKEVGDGEGDGDGAGAGLAAARVAAGAGDEAATLVLLQERLLWRDRTGAELLSGSVAPLIAAVERRYLVVPRVELPAEPLPMDLHRAAGLLRGSRAMLLGGFDDDDDDSDAGDAAGGEVAAFLAGGRAPGRGRGGGRGRGRGRSAAAAVEAKARADFARLVPPSRWDAVGFAGRDEAAAEAEAPPPPEVAVAAEAPPRATLLLSSGETVDLFDAHAALLAAENGGGAAARHALEAALSPDAEFLVCPGSEAATPTLTIRGADDIIAHFRRHQFPLSRKALRTIQPAELWLDGRTAVTFGRAALDGGVAPEQLQDVVSWGDDGRVCRWVRVRGAPLTHRQWVGHCARGDGAAVTPLLHPDILVRTAEGTLLLGAAEALREIVGDGASSGDGRALLPRMKGKVLRIGRTQELDRSAWPCDGHAPRVGNAPPRATQTVILGEWRAAGAKWYSGRPFALRERIEWATSSGRLCIVRLEHEVLPDGHPQAAPVWARWREKEQAALDAARAALKAKDSYTNAATWDAKPAKPVARSRKGLKVSGS